MTKTILFGLLSLALLSGCSSNTSTTVGPPLLSDGILYVRSVCYLTAYDKKSGEVIWNHKTNGQKMRFCEDAKEKSN